MFWPEPCLHRLPILSLLPGPARPSPRPPRGSPLHPCSSVWAPRAPLHLASSRLASVSVSLSGILLPAPPSSPSPSQPLTDHTAPLPLSPQRPDGEQSRLHPPPGLRPAAAVPPVHSSGESAPRPGSSALSSLGQRGEPLSGEGWFLPLELRGPSSRPTLAARPFLCLTVCLWFCSLTPMSSPWPTPARCCS